MAEQHTQKLPGIDHILDPVPESHDTGHGFGTAPVFLASISTILGAIMFLRFGYAVGHVGLPGALLIILLGHLVTIPTALAIAEIATNRRVEGGGEYFIISRSFGATLGASIGISLYFSQALSVAFYMIAFAEAFQPLAPYIESLLNITFDPRLISLPAMTVLAMLVLFRGANIGVKALWVVAGLLAVSLALFFLGSRPEGVDTTNVGLFDTIQNPDPFILVFAIVFPGFTGMTAGVGLSGDLKRPRKSIPLGILSATCLGIIVYIGVVIKLAASATPDMLAEDQLIMAKIAVWGPVIPIGLGCATLSSAIGSILVAPRTLQALSSDRVIPLQAVNTLLSRGVGAANEPRNATLVTVVLALVTIFLGNVDFVARLISMFFMVTYGALCAISFLEHFAARPSYRPSFRSKWYLSLLGALMCLALMFQMDPVYAILAIVIMSGIYFWFRTARGGEDDLASIFQGVMTQITRYFQIRLQRRMRTPSSDEWRPSIIMIDSRTFTGSAPIQFFTWMCHRYGFGTYLHYIPGELDAKNFYESRKVLRDLIELTQTRHSAIYVDTMIAPSIQDALAQTLQVSGISGMENNTILFELSSSAEPAVLDEVVNGMLMAGTTRMNGLVLRHGHHFFGSRSKIHIWLTWHDYANANLMIILAYILLGHPDWHGAEIAIFAAFPHEEVEQREKELFEMITTGRLPISQKNLRIIPTDAQVDFAYLVRTYSDSADLVIFGLTQSRLREKGHELLLRHPDLRDVLFVCAQEKILIE